MKTVLLAMKVAEYIKSTGHKKLRWVLLTRVGSNPLLMALMKGHKTLQLM
jgi:hypothetical protein